MAVPTGRVDREVPPRRGAYPRGLSPCTQRCRAYTSALRGLSPLDVGIPRSKTGVSCDTLNGRSLKGAVMTLAALPQPPAAADNEDTIERISARRRFRPSPTSGQAWVPEVIGAVTADRV